MIALTMVMLRSRRIQALVAFGVAAIAVAAAVAAPLYVEVAERVLVANDVAAATPAQLSVTAHYTALKEAFPGNTDDERRVATSGDFELHAPAAMTGPGLTTIFSAAVRVFARAAEVPDQAEKSDGLLSFRQDFCAHVTMLSGRCVAAPGEVIISAARAAGKIGVGAAINTSATVLIPGQQGEPSFYARVGRVSTFGVVGIYQPRDPADRYWGSDSAQFLPPELGPILTGRSTLASLQHRDEEQTVISYVDPAELTVDSLDSYRARVQALLANAATLNPVSDADTLLTKITADRAAVRVVPGVAALPLVALCWFVLFLAIAHAAQARRAELGMAKLRGASARDQWWLASAESFLSVFAGGLLGYLIGHSAVWAYARFALGGRASVPVSTGPLAYAGVALLGGLAAGLLAVRRDLASSPTDLLRRVPARGGAWRGVSLALLVVVLAGVAVAQVRADPATQSGLGRLAPALAILGLGLLCAVLVDPVAAGLGGFALRRGRIGLGIGALQVGRRRTGARILTLVVVATALLTFAATANAVATDVRIRQAEVAVGADRVLTVTGASPFQLLAKVRQVDPSGDYAMAVVPILNENRLDLLAIDATRLPRAASWPASGISVADAATLLHPPRDDATIVRGSGLRLTATVPTVGGDGVFVLAELAPLDGGPVRQHRFPPLRAGRHTYEASVSCADGCLLLDLRVVVDDLRAIGGDAVPQHLQFTFNELAQTGPDRRLADGATFGRWLNRSLNALMTTGGPEGLRGDVVQANTSNGLRLAPPHTPQDLPILGAGQLVMLTLQLNDGQRITTTMAGDTPLLPRLGAKGLFMDLDDLLRSGNPIVSSARDMEIWLGPGAPADAKDRFTAAGLRVVGERTPGDALAASAEGATTLGLRFLVIVAFLGVALGALGLVVAGGVERRWRGEEARALRIQGVGRGQVVAAAMFGYVVIVGVAAALGIGVGAAVWWLTGRFLPLADGAASGLTIAALPGTAALRAWAIGSGLLLCVALVLALSLGRANGSRTREGRVS